MPPLLNPKVANTPVPNNQNSSRPGMGGNKMRRLRPNSAMGPQKGALSPSEQIRAQEQMVMGLEINTFKESIKQPSKPKAVKFHSSVSDAPRCGNVSMSRKKMLAPIPQNKDPVFQKDASFECSGNILLRNVKN